MAGTRVVFVHGPNENARVKAVPSLFPGIPQCGPSIVKD